MAAVKQIKEIIVLGGQFFMSCSPVGVIARESTENKFVYGRSRTVGPGGALNLPSIDLI
jgi:hypothetical protein